MDFTLDTEQKALRDAIREMASRFTISDRIGPPELDRDQWQALAETGVLLADGLGPVEEMLVAEELGRARVRLPYAETLLAGHVLAAAGQTDLVGRIESGEAIVVPALSEPNRSWRSASTTTFADGAVSGVKDPVPYAAAATHAVVATDCGLCLVEAPPVVGSGLAFDTTPAIELDRALLSPALHRATVALCAEALGAMQAALDLTVAYLKTRKQFGAPLMTFQSLTHRAADCYVELELARSMVQYAAMSLADPSHEELAEREALVSRTKVVVGRAARLIGQEAIQLHGGIGMTAEYAVGHLTSRLTAIEHTWGDRHQHLAGLAAGVGEYTTVDVL